MPRPSLISSYGNRKSRSRILLRRLLDFLFVWAYGGILAFLQKSWAVSGWRQGSLSEHGKRSGSESPCRLTLLLNRPRVAALFFYRKWANSGRMMAILEAST